MSVTTETAAAIEEVLSSIDPQLKKQYLGDDPFLFRECGQVDDRKY